MGRDKRTLRDERWITQARWPAIVILLLLTTACASTRSLSHEIEAATNQPPFHRAFWSILVEDDDGRVIYARNAGKLTIPASNRKLFAAATVADCLGLDAQLETQVWRDGEDLIIRGDGDPSLGSVRYERQGDFDALAERLRRRGVTHVRDVIADVSRFDRDTFPGGWKHGNLGSDYAAPVDALAWAENVIPPDRAVDDPGMSTAVALREALLAHGIEISGVARVNIEPHAWEERLDVIPSPFVFQLLTTMLQNSQNLYAEMLLKRLGDGTYDNALVLERGFLERAPRLEDDAFRFVDGCGLAPDDLVTPESLVRLLRWMNEPSRRGIWWMLLAQPNQEGTLHRRLLPLEDRLRGKTGTINGVNALSGIIRMPHGRYRYFSIIVNHHAGQGSEAIGIIDHIVEVIAR